MIYNSCRLRFSWIITLLLGLGLSLSASDNRGEEIHEKRTKVAMRTIGHEILLSVGDSNSRVLPVELDGSQYRISFDTEFGFNPDDIIPIIDSVLINTKTAVKYIIGVEQCSSGDVVYSYEISEYYSPDRLTCRERPLPKDCYVFLINILEGFRPIEAGNDADDAAFSLNDSESANLFNTPFLLGLIVLLLVIIAYFIRKGRTEVGDPDLVQVGASKFDKRNMAISFRDKVVELSNKEAALLALLHDSANKAIEREVILKKVWGDEGAYIGRTLDVFISKLRKKLEEDSSVKIINIRGYGYKLVMNKSE